MSLGRRQPRRAGLDRAGDPGPASGAQRRGGRELHQQVPHAAVGQSGTDGTLERWGDAGQGVAQPVGEPGDIRGQVDVEPVEHPELVEQLVAADIEPVDLTAAHASGVRDHERIAAVGLGLTRIQVRSTAHHQAGHIGDRHAALTSDRDSELRDRAGLVDHQPRRSMPGGPFQERIEVGFVVADRPSEDRLAAVVEDIGEVLFLADVQPDPHIHIFRCDHRVSCRSKQFRAGRPSTMRSPSSTLRTSD